MNQKKFQSHPFHIVNIITKFEFISNSISISQIFIGVEMQDGEMEGSESGELREQDRFLPIANVARIMKKGIPSQGKIAKDARECVQECVSEFISFITSEASDRCQAEKVSIPVILVLFYFILNKMIPINRCTN